MPEFTLDDVFGPREDDTETQNVGASQDVPTERTDKRTNWPAAEERIRGILDTWNELMQCWDWGPWERKRLVAGARDYVDAVGSDIVVLRDAFIYNREHGLTQSTPRSCITQARRLTAGPRKYTESEGEETEADRQKRQRYADELKNFQVPSGDL